MRDDRDRSSTVLPAVIGTGVLAAIVYVLSYAPVIRYRNGADLSTMDFGGAIICVQFDDSYFETPILYRTVEWLLDETPCYKLHRCWERVWQIENHCSTLRSKRLLRKFAAASTEARSDRISIEMASPMGSSTN